EARDRDRGEQSRGDRKCAVAEKERGGAPANQGLRVHPGPDIAAKQLEVFAQVDPRAELRDRGLTPLNFLNGGRVQEPSRERLFALPGPRGAKPLEERS